MSLTSNSCNFIALNTNSFIVKTRISQTTKRDKITKIQSLFLCCVPVLVMSSQWNQPHAHNPNLTTRELHCVPFNCQKMQLNACTFLQSLAAWHLIKIIFRYYSTKYFWTWGFTIYCGIFNLINIKHSINLHITDNVRKKYRNRLIGKWTT